jgi:hypothetical protein
VLTLALTFAVRQTDVAGWLADKLAGADICPNVTTRRRSPMRIE